jgi:pilus assembly protein CpaB
MRAKSLILLTVALGCGMVAAVAVSKTLMEREGATEEATLEILVATQEIKTASKIAVDKIKLEKWPKSRLPEGAILNIKDVEGKYASQNLFAGEPLLAQKLSASNNGLGTTIPAGYTIFDIPNDNNYIKPGDWVDISGTFTPAGGKNKTPEVKTVLQGVQVFAINGNPDRNAKNDGGKGTEFNLLIKQGQYQALLLASSLGKLDMNVRPLDDDGNIKTATDDTGESFMNWAREQAVDPTAALTSSDKVERPVAVFSQPSLEVQPQARSAKNELLIVTPEGVKRFEYSGKEMPKEVSQVTQESKAAPVPTNPWITGSGFGGYSPTYPTTYATAPGTPAPGVGMTGQNSGSSAPPTSFPAGGEKSPKSGPIN